MARAGLTRDRVLAEAGALIDAQGADALTLAMLAKHLGVRTPSLYNHVQGLPDLRRALTLDGLDALRSELSRAAAGRAGRDALMTVAVAYRRFALAHPGLYALAQQAVTPAGSDGAAALQGNASAAGDDALSRASAGVVAVVAAVMRGYGLEGDDALHATRALRSALHGFVTLEAGGGFGLPLDLDVSFERLLAWLDAGLAGGGLSG